MNRRGRDGQTTEDKYDSSHPDGSAAGRAGSDGVRRSRRKRRPSRILGMWARIGLLSGAVALLLTIAVAIVAKVIEPYREASVQRGQLAEMNRQIAQTDAENNAYQRRLAYLNTPQGVMTEARKLGYLRPGEVAVMVEGTPGVLDETPVTPPQPPAPTLLGRIRRFFGVR